MSPINHQTKGEADNGDAEVRPVRGRPRSEDSHEAVLGAVLEILDKEGYGALTIESVARHAGVGKQTIYRWWPSKAEVVLEALAERASTRIRAPGVGTLADEVAAFLAQTFRTLTGPHGTAPLMRALMAEAQLEPAFAARFRAALIDQRRAALVEVFVRHGVAEERHGLLLDLAFGPMWYRLLLQYSSLDAAFARELADAVARAA